MKKFPHPYKALLCIIIPAFYLLSVLLFDRHEPIRTVSPPLLSIGLLVFSLLIGTGWMIFWASIYSITSSVILLNPNIYAFFSNGLLYPEMSSHKFRIAGFVTTAVFACIFSWLLNRLRSKKEMLNQLFLRMPIPVVISDIEGTIDLTNDKALILLGLSRTGKEKGLFFDLFAPRSHQGKCISTYLNIFKQGSTDNISLQIEVLGKPAIAHIELLNTTPRKLVTMIQTGE